MNTKKTENYRILIFKNKNLVILSIISLILTTIDYFLKRYFLKINSAILNNNFMYGFKIFSQETTNFLLIMLFIIFAMITINGIIKNNELKYLIIPLIASTSNLIDRIQIGSVIDYININLPIFNQLFGYFNLSDAQISIFIITSLAIIIYSKKSKK